MTVEPASGLVETIFGWVYDYIVGASMKNFATGESFLEGGKAGPGVARWCPLWCDTPKIESF